MKNGVILFDGVCDLCNSTVRWVLKNDKKEKFSFASLQSDYGFKFLTNRRLNTSDFDTFILYVPKVAYYTKSTAALKVLAELNLFYYVIANLLLIIPRSIRDEVYNLVSRNRTKIYKNNDSCLVPTPEIQKRFLS
jgi:predicted DCC family thiol-disulfide oxidoreductase YuxK